MNSDNGFRLYRSFAKINIFLEVVGKRPDNYHEIESLFARISLFDEIYIKKSDSIKIEMINNVNAYSIDMASNLVYKAFLRFKERFMIDDGVEIKIIKNIPLGSGLGGGSSNCACALKAYADLFEIKDYEKLKEIASELGSDVMFFLKDCSFAICKGRGEIVEPVSFNFRLPNIILIFPEIHISTKDVYQQLKLDYKPLKLSQRIRDDIKNGRSIDITSYLFNRLEDVSFKMNNRIKDLKDELSSLKIYSLMSGSGSSVFGLSYDDKILTRAFDVLKEKYRFIYLLKFV